ncbi:MAG TPA: type II and III secretion system protein family protein [Hyphomicrobiales bacterium]|nr:type II and III secretion system protein family protein [Hyphomicrobiales bacterium]
MRARPVSAWLGLAGALALLLPGTARAADQIMDGPAWSGAHRPGREVELGVGKSYVVDLPRDASEVLVADPKIANAVVRSARRAYLIGVKVGETDVIFFDPAGHQIAALAVNVGQDLAGLRESLRASIPTGRVQVQAVGASIMLTGSVHSAADAQTAVSLATQAAGGDAKKVVNALKIEDRDQVMIKVEVVEMDRNVEKQLGIQWNLQSIGATMLAAGSNPAFGLGSGSPGAVLSGLGAVTNSGNGIGISTSGKNFSGYANIQALEQNSLARLLAAPTLTAISGEAATFLAGGEFPYPSALDQNGNPVLTFKKFGVTLNFTPVVLSDGRISLQIFSEVSQLDFTTGIKLGSITVPALTARQTGTTVELPSGGTLAISGLLQNDVRQAVNGLPGLGNIPVLGALFRSRDFQTQQTDLVVLVTPYLVKPVARNKLATPGDNFEPASDPQAILFGKLNRIYAAGDRKVPVAAYRGDYGFTIK